jgi:RAD3-like DEAD/DEAH box helicase
VCAIIISPSTITFTPPFVPIRTLPYFAGSVRRIYLSATLSAADVFVRTFGRAPSVQIKPSTTAGECERMIIVPLKMQDASEDDVGAAKAAIRNHKTLVLVPSYLRAEEWLPLKPPPKERATEMIEEFKTAKGTKKLLLAARYDGMDLPGDMCRVIVIDDLPSGLNPLDRYLWEYLRLSNRLLTAIATRIIQSFGRISRGMSDHGVVLLTGKRLVEWLQVPRNAAALPRFLQKQLQLGFQMSASAAAAAAASMIESCLGRNADWVTAYERFIREAPVEADAPTPENLADIALAEAKYAEHMWNRDFEGAARRLRETLDIAAKISLGTVCWHNLWLGFALECAGDPEGGRRLHRQAHTGERNIPPPRPNDKSIISEKSTQVVGASYQFELAPNARIQAPRTLDRDLLSLSADNSAGQTEEALRFLGQYLGFQSSRPEKEHGTGPDVLWIFPDSSALCIDVKTNKEDSSVYRKSELGQLSDHVQWVRDNFSATDITPIFIGPEVTVSDVANPPVGVKVAKLDKFRTIADTLIVAYRDIASGALSTTLIEVINEEFAKRNLLWPVLISGLGFVELRSLTSK